MTIRLAPDRKARLERLAKATGRSKSFLAAEAIRDFVDLNEWQVGEIQKAVAEADREEFASTERVDEVFGKWGVRAGQMVGEGAQTTTSLTLLGGLDSLGVTRESCTLAGGTPH